MSYQYKKNENTRESELIIAGFETGVAPSPHAGMGNMQGVNISTELGEAMCSFTRIQQSQGVITGGSLSVVNTNTLAVTTSTGTTDNLVGTWIHINSGITGLPAGDYYVINSPAAGQIQISSSFSQVTSSTPTNVSGINLLVVGAGGGGGTANSGGGGGGGEVISTTFRTSVQAHTVTVGGITTGGSDGANSVFGTIATGRGGKQGVSATPGTGGDCGDTVHSGGATVASAGGGGGGNSANGSPGTLNLGGNGGDGVSSAISGASVTYGGGGGGSSGGGSGVGGTGGLGGGGNGGGNLSVGQSAGTANTGGGGGGGSGGGGVSAGGSGMVIVSYPTGTMTATGGAITTSGGNTIHTFTSSGTFTVSSFPTTTYILSGFSGGPATFTIYTMTKPIMSASEPYTDVNGISQFRYYILDDSGVVWIHDTFTLPSLTTPIWFATEVPPTLNGRKPSGLAVLNGWVTFALDTLTFWKSTSILTLPFTSSYQMMSNTFHNTLVGHQGRMYYTDGNFVGSIFPNSSLVSGLANIQSYFLYTAATTTATVTDLIGGSYPNFAVIPKVRLPIVFFTAGLLPASLTVDTSFNGYTVSIIYYIEWTGLTNPTFQVFAASTGGSALDMQTGSSGNQYANNFFPFGSAPQTMVTFTPQRLNLPFFETAQCLGELGNTVIIGGSTNTLYPWDQVSALPSGVIPLPESNVTKLTTVNSMMYVLAGQKGNVYVTNGSSASLSISIPDYCAGIAGTPSTYIEPFFTWGDMMFLRGRVYLSIQDQTSTKVGNCGGIWSFVPSNNYYIGQDAGASIRLENQNSYATYNGAASVLLASQQQNAIAPQFWSGWYSSISAPTYGIDFTGTTPTTTTLIETDLIPTGTFLDKKTWKQIEYKLASPLAVGETVSISYRQNGTDAFATCGTAIVESTTGLSGYFPVNFEKGQWLQLQVTLNPVATTASSFCRLQQVIVR